MEDIDRVESGRGALLSSAIRFLPLEVAFLDETAEWDGFDKAY